MALSIYPNPEPQRVIVGHTHGSTPTESIAPDCKHYRGDRPCIHNRLCTGCTHYQPYTSRICVIKIGALGDVIRTLCILPELRRRYPDGQITWVTKPNACRMLSGHPMVDRLMPIDPVTASVLPRESFDVVINLDKEAEPCALAGSLRASTRLGISLSAHGTPVPADQDAVRYFELGLSDDLKFSRNTKSYPRLIYDALGYTYRGERYRLHLPTTARDAARRYLHDRGWSDSEPTLGINVGSGDTFANKMWPADWIIDLIRKRADGDGPGQMLLLGGQRERPIIDQITRALPALVGSGYLIDAGTHHDEQTFASLVGSCDVLLTGDTMAMHVAIALDLGVVAYIGPTCEQEIDLFGCGEKLVANVSCAPCYKRVCDQADRCVQAVSTEEAIDAIERVSAMIRPAGRDPIPTGLAKAA